MAKNIIFKKSTVADKIPLPEDLQPGEIAINLTDGRIFSKHPDGSIVNLSGSSDLHTHTISQIDGLQAELDSLVEDAPETGDHYVRQNGEWVSIGNITDGVYTSIDFEEDFSNKTSDELTEGLTNLYFSAIRATNAIKSDPDWKATQWDQAYAWGDHSQQGYLTSANVDGGHAGSVYTAQQILDGGGV